MSLDVTEVGIEGLDFFVDLVDGQNLYAVLLDCDEFVVIVVEE